MIYRNILIDDEENIILTDFGISRIYDSTDTSVTQGQGTPDYTSPENSNGDQYDYKTDVW